MRVVDHPALGRLTYPDTMSDSAIYEDIDSKIMKAMTPQPKTTAFGQVKEFGKQLIPGAGGLLEQAAKGVAGYGADVLQQRYADQHCSPSKREQERDIPSPSDGRYSPRFEQHQTRR